MDAAAAAKCGQARCCIGVLRQASGPSSDWASPLPSRTTDTNGLDSGLIVRIVSRNRRPDLIRHRPPDRPACCNGGRRAPAGVTGGRFRYRLRSTTAGMTPDVAVPGMERRADRLQPRPADLPGPHLRGVSRIMTRTPEGQKSLRLAARHREFFHDRPAGSLTWRKGWNETVAGRRNPREGRSLRRYR